MTVFAVDGQYRVNDREVNLERNVKSDLYFVRAILLKTIKRRDIDQNCVVSSKKRKV